VTDLEIKRTRPTINWDDPKIVALMDDPDVLDLLAWAIHQAEIKGFDAGKKWRNPRPRKPARPTGTNRRGPPMHIDLYALGQLEDVINTRADGQTKAAAIRAFQQIMERIVTREGGVKRPDGWSWLDMSPAAILAALCWSRRNTQ
jgi:hypothetical protein